MAHKHLMPRGLELFKKDWHPDDIASELGVSRRTVYRWIEQDKQQKSNSSKAKSTAKKPNNIEVLQTEKIDIELFDKDWVNAASAIALDHYLTHAHYKNQLRSVYDDCLKNEPGNARKINNLGLALDRHIQGERVASSLENLDFTRACKTLEKFGFTAVRKDALESE